MDDTRQLRVLIANQRADRLERIATVVTSLGHEVIAREVHVSEVAAATAKERPDVAFVGLGESAEHALEMITEISSKAYCPVIALLETYDPRWIDQAAVRGIYAYIVDTRPDELQSAIDITLRRFGDYQELQGAFHRRDAQQLKDDEQMQQKQRQVLALQDGVVQALTVAQLALDLDQTDESRGAMLEGLHNARSIVAESINDLVNQGVPLHELIPTPTESTS